MHLSVPPLILHPGQPSRCVDSEETELCPNSRDLASQTRGIFESVKDDSIKKREGLFTDMTFGDSADGKNHDAKQQDGKIASSGVGSQAIMALDAEVQHA